MPIDLRKPGLLTKPILEGVLLLAITPWLLFPTQFPFFTLVALVISAVFWLWPWVRRRKSFPATPFNTAFLIFLMAVLVGILASDEPSLTLPKSAGIILGFTTFRYIVSVVPEEVGFKKAAILLLVIGLGFTTIGVLGVNWSQKAPFLAPVYNLLPDHRVVLPEAPGEGINANQLAAILLLIMPLSLSLIIGWNSKDGNRPVMILLTILTLCTAALLLLTQSRAGWIGGLSAAGAVLFLWLLIPKPSHRRRYLLVTLAGVFILFVLTIAAIGAGEFGRVWDEPAEAVDAGTLAPVNFRLEVWKWALIAIEDLPLTGTGLGTFRQAVRDLYPIGIRAGYDIGHAHNIFLQVALDAGIPGLVAYLSILILAFTSGWRAARHLVRQRPLAVGLLASLFALHVFGLADALAPGSKPGLIFWLMLGLLGAMANASAPTARVRISPDLAVDASQREAR